jgi:hypothetical protein
MSLHAQSRGRPLSAAVPGRLVWIRRPSVAVLVLLVAEYGTGMYVNLYGTAPRPDHDGSLTSAITHGPIVFSTHVVIGVLLGLGAAGVLVQAIRARHPGAVSASALGLFAMVIAAAAGASFTSSGNPADSMAMSVLTGVGLLCYAANLYLLRD